MGKSTRSLSDSQLKNAVNKLGCKCTNDLSNFIYELNGYTIFIDQVFTNVTPTVSMYLTNKNPIIKLSIEEIIVGLHEDVLKRVKNVNLSAGNPEISKEPTLLTFEVKGTLAHNDGIEIIKYVLTEITNILTEKEFATCCADCKATENLKNYIGDGFSTTLCQPCKDKRVEFYKSQTNENYLAKKENHIRGIIASSISGLVSFLFIMIFNSFQSVYVPALATGVITTVVIVTVYRFAANSFTKISICISFFLTAIFITLQSLILSAVFKTSFSHYLIFITAIISFVLMCKLYFSRVRDPRELIEINLN